MSDADDEAALTAELTARGVALPPGAAYVRRPPPSPGPLVAVVVDLVAEVEGAPPYCVHGYVRCVRCRGLCYLGSETVKLVTGGQTQPLCVGCARTAVAEDAAAGHVVDHPRP